MSILLVAATSKEIQPFLNQYRKKQRLQAVDILITGVGLTAATYALMRQVRLKRPNLMIQAGIAGCFDRSISRGDVVLVKKERIADEGVMENGKLQSLIDLKLSKKDSFPYRNGWLENRSAVLKQWPLQKVTGISVNDISNSAERVNAYRKQYRAVVESMEGAAFHYTAIMENIPFVQLRAISNYAGVRDKKKWKIKEAVNNLNKELFRLIDAL